MGEQRNKKIDTSSLKKQSGIFHINYPHLYALTTGVGDRVFHLRAQVMTQ